MSPDITGLEALINRIAAEYAVPGWLGRGIAWGESGHCWGKPFTDPCWIATEPDGRRSAGPFQIHDIHRISMELRLDPEFNTRWAMENSVGPYYRQALVLGITDRRGLLAYVWRYGQRCAREAIAPAVERAMQYLEREEEEMPDPEHVNWLRGKMRIQSKLSRLSASYRDHPDQPLDDEVEAWIDLAPEIHTRAENVPAMRPTRAQCQQWANDPQTPA